MQAARPLLEKIVRDALRRAPREEAALWAWPLLCGAAVAGKTEAIDCAGNRLRVSVPDETWRAQLQVFRGQYIAALEKLIGVKLDGIDFEVATARPAAKERP
jgi:hypothetical protein